MKRREFIKLISGAAAVWPVTARAQRPKQVRQIGAQFAWYYGRNNDQEVEVLTKSLQALGWTDGQNVHVDYRWAEKDLGRMETLANEILNQNPDVILAQITPVAAAFQHKTKTTPILFVAVTDLVISGLVASLSRPAGRAANPWATAAIGSRSMQYRGSHPSPFAYLSRGRPSAEAGGRSGSITGHLKFG